jgi:hypothetical protein
MELFMNVESFPDLVSVHTVRGRERGLLPEVKNQDSYAYAKYPTARIGKKEYAPPI